MKDYYKILGVDRQASTEQIKKAYRSLAKKYHPDVVKDDKAKQERMYEIQEAYACLENEERRKKYDAECLKSPRNTVNAGEKVKNGRTSFGEKSPDMGQFERFFGFQPGRGMETYQDHRISKPEGPIKPEEMFAAFFGRGSMQEAEKRNAAGSKRKTAPAPHKIIRTSSVCLTLFPFASRRISFFCLLHASSSEKGCKHFLGFDRPLRL
jgi:DnaJ-class molecular chaperone